MTLASKRFAVLTIVSVLLSACTQITLVEPKRQKIGDAFSVETRIAWNRIPADKIEVWTVDGIALQAVRFFKGIKDQETLFKSDESAKMPVFRADMTPNDVMELVIDTLSRSGASQVETSGLRPADFGDATGFRFEFGFLDADGLEAEGMANGAVIDGRLFMIVYTGARIHYYPKHRDDVDQLFQSVETT